MRLSVRTSFRPINRSQFHHEASTSLLQLTPVEMHLQSSEKITPPAASLRLGQRWRTGSVVFRGCELFGSLPYLLHFSCLLVMNDYLKLRRAQDC